MASAKQLAARARFKAMVAGKKGKGKKAPVGGKNQHQGSKVKGK